MQSNTLNIIQRALKSSALFLKDRRVNCKETWTVDYSEEYLLHFGLHMQIKINKNQVVIPSMSSDTGVRRMSPVNSHAVFLASMPDVPSNTWANGGINEPLGFQSNLKDKFQFSPHQ